MIAWIAERLLWINLAWYIVLAVAFAFAGGYAKALYFLGAVFITVGIMMM